MAITQVNHTIDNSGGRRSRLVPLRHSDPDFVHAENLFLEGWKHPDKAKPHVRTIFKILCAEEALAPYLKYRTYIQSSLPRRSMKNKYPGNECMRFHGTNRACFLGEDTNNVRPCWMPECSLCCIIRNSFETQRCGSKHQFRRFGTGIYTTAVSSKADDYSLNLREDATFRVMLLNRVVIGKPLKRLQNAKAITKLPSGYHSVLGKPGQDLNYEENIVYRNEAIRPAYVLVYGDAPKVSSKMKAFVSKLFMTPLAS